LALFVEAGNDDIVLFKGDEQGWQWRIVVVTALEVVPRLPEWNPGKPLNTP
jgi:hypothetical protein